MVPCDFAEAPEPSFDPEALPPFIDASQAEGLALPPIVTTAPASQDHAAQRLAHTLGRIEAGTLPPCAIVAPADPLEPIAHAVARAGADDVDVDASAFPILAVPTWALVT